MKKLIFILLFALVPVVGFSQLQQTQQTQQTQQVQTLSPTIVVGDLAFISQTLKTVEIKGAEVDAFLQVDQEITKILQDLSKQQKKANDSAEIKINLDIAKNCLAFMDRATLSGQNAVIYKRFVEALVNSAKKK